MRTIFTFFTVLIFSVSAYSQTFPYSIGTSSNTYVEFTEGLSLAQSGWDDPEFTLPLGFEMEILGTTIDSIYQSGYGAGFYSTDLITIDIFEPYASDLIDAGDDEPSTISYMVEGTVGNRIGKLQYANCGFYDDEDPTFPQRVNFQVWFYEVDNAIEVHYGPNSITNSEMVHMGNEGPITIFASEFNVVEENFTSAWAITGTPFTLAPTTIDYNEDNYPGFSSNPASGMVIRYAPSAVSVNETLSESFSLYPNPFVEQLSVNLSSGKATTYTIYNSVGNVILSGKLETSENTLDLNNLATGVYILQIDGQQKKIVKQ